MKIAICEDEKCFQDEIKQLVERLANNAQIDVFSDGSHLIGEEIIDYDLVFLDIEMQTLDGIKTAQLINEKNNKILIFFITSHTSYITDALRTGAFQYIIKPIDSKIFAHEFQRALEKLKKQRNQLEVTWLKTKRLVKIDDILYLEHASRKISIYLVDGTVVEGVGKLSSYTEKLQGYDFVQCHKSYLVNLEKVSSIKAYEIYFRGGKMLGISKAFLVDFREKHRQYISGVII